MNKPTKLVNQTWRLKSKCANDLELQEDLHNRYSVNFDFFYAKDKKQDAKDYCRNCPVLQQCGQEMVSEQKRMDETTGNSAGRAWKVDGIWGGTSAKELVTEQRKQRKRALKFLREQGLAV